MATRPSLTQVGVRKLDKLLRESVKSRRVPATFFGLTNSKETFYWKCHGPVDFENPDGPAVDENTVFGYETGYHNLAYIGQVAALQLVDRGLASLDDPTLILQHLPELSSLRILKGYDEQDEPKWEDPTMKITLRMLLSHTSGLGSVNRSPDLLKWAQSENLNTRYLGPHTTEKSYLYPLLFNPGSAWVYGVGLDWAGILISRVTGKSLEDHFREAIFEKAGMRDTTFYPTGEVKRRLMRMTTQESREAPIKVCSDNFSGLGSLSRTSDPDKVGVMSGGAGLFSTTKDYLAFLRGILASQSATDPKALLSPSSFEELFNDAFRPETDDEHFLSTLKGHELHDPALFDQEGASKKDRKIVQSVGMAVNLVDSANGRKAGSGCWDGAARTMYWIDPKTGLAGICMTNVLCPEPNEFYRLYQRFERAVYDGLSEEEADVPMPDTSAIKPDHRFLFKPLEKTQDGGCHASVWLPKVHGGFDSGTPIAIFYHGGGWCSGSSLQLPYYQVRYLLKKGIPVVSFDHRLTPHVTLKEIREDLLDSYKYVQHGLNRDLEAAGSKVVVDGSCSAAFGWSAGASNTIYLANEIELHNSRCESAVKLPALKAIVPTYPLVTFDVLCEPKSAFEDAAKASPLLARSIERVQKQGCSTYYEMPEEYWPRIIEIASGSEGEELEMDRENARCIWLFKNKSLCSFLAGSDRPYPETAEPIKLISKNFPPTCVVAASADGLIPTEQFRHVYERVNEQGIDALYVECKGMRHAEAECLPLTPGWPEGNTWWRDALLPSLQFALRHMTEDR